VRGNALNNDSSAVLFGVFNIKRTPLERGSYYPTSGQISLMQSVSPGLNSNLPGKV
jgi:hypothetical protein